MADVTGEEFRTFMTILSSLKVMASAHQELADIVTEQAELNQPFQVSDKIYHIHRVNKNSKKDLETEYTCIILY